MDDEKEKEIAATNKLLNIIRGENDLNKKRVMPSQVPPQNAINKGDEDKTSKQPNQKTSILSRKHKIDSKRFPSVTNVSFLQKTQKISKRENYPLPWFLKGKEKRALGLDIGSHSLKFVLVTKGLAGFKVLDYKIMELPIEQIDDKGAASIKFLKSMINGLNLENTRIISSVSGPSVIVRHVQFPPMNEKELMQSLNWEAKSYIPFPLNEINLDYQVLPRKGKEHRLDVILVAVTKKTLRYHLNLLERASIKPDIIDIDPLVLVNTYMITKDDSEIKTIALINIGAQITILSIYRPGSLFFTRDIRIGGNAFTKQIQSQLKISYEEAELIKRGGAINKTSSAKEQDVTSILKPVVNELISEVRRSLIYYDNQTGKKGFGEITLTGGGALLSSIPEAFSSELGLPIKFLDPFKTLNMDRTDYPTLMMKEQSERLSLSVGLALRGVL